MGPAGSSPGFHLNRNIRPWTGLEMWQVKERQEWIKEWTQLKAKLCCYHTINCHFWALGLQFFVRDFRRVFKWIGLYLRGLINRIEKVLRNKLLVRCQFKGHLQVGLPAQLVRVCHRYHEVRVRGFQLFFSQLHKLHLQLRWSCLHLFLYFIQQSNKFIWNSYILCFISYLACRIF